MRTNASSWSSTGRSSIKQRVQIRLSAPPTARQITKDFNKFFASYTPSDDGDDEDDAQQYEPRKETSISSFMTRKGSRVYDLKQSVRGRLGKTPRGRAFRPVITEAKLRRFKEKKHAEIRANVSLVEVEDSSDSESGSVRVKSRKANAKKPQVENTIRGPTASASDIVAPASGLPVFSSEPAVNAPSNGPSPMATQRGKPPFKFTYHYWDGNGDLHSNEPPKKYLLELTPPTDTAYWARMARGAQFRPVREMARRASGTSSGHGA